MLKILVVEDSDLQRKNLCLILSKLNTDILIYEADNKYTALEIAQQNHIDFFFVDVELKNSSGIDFAKEIRDMQQYKLSWIIFITTYINHMITAFKEIHCYDYILKPYNPDDIKNIVNTIIDNDYNKNSVKNREYVLFDQKNLKVKIFLDDILFIEVNIGKCVVHTIVGQYVINRLSLKNIIKMLNCTYILQCHRSCAVNIKHIIKIEKYSQKSWNIYFNNYEHCAFMGEKYKDEILQLIEENSSANLSIGN